MINRYCFVCGHIRSYKWWQRLFRSSEFGKNRIGTYCPNCKATYGEAPDGYELKLVPRDCSDQWIIKDALWDNGKPYLLKRKVR